jgi:hypothetical protein
VEDLGRDVKWVCPAFASEGPTDDRFLPNVINRAIVDLCARHFSDYVEVADAVVVRDRGGPASIPDVVAELRRNAGSYNMVIFHHDAGANRDRVDREWVEPMRAAWAATDSSDPLIFVVPVRETEAWALADGDAIRRVYGVSWDNARLGVPDNPRDVCDVHDPKKVLAAIGKAVGSRVTNYHARLGELVSLDRLAAVEAYSEWRGHMVHVLEHDIRLTRQG